MATRMLGCRCGMKKFFFFLISAVSAVWEEASCIFYSPSKCPHLQALLAQEDLEKAKLEHKNAVTVVLGRHAENEHDEHDENHAEASAELSNEGVSDLDLRSEEDRVTEAQKNQRVKQQLQVRVY